MIKIERKETEKAELAKKDLDKAKTANSSYNTENVNMALRDIFHGKCYICENKKATSYQIEHLIPYKGNIDLKYKWDNLFWVCAHCNNIKLDKYNPIIDCTKEDVETLIAFRKEGYFGEQEELVFTPLKESKEVENTIELLYDAYYGTTLQKKMEAKILRKLLRENLSMFKNYVREYYEAEGSEKEDLELLLKRELRDSSEFTAFKRWLIYDNERYSELKNIWKEE